MNAQSLVAKVWNFAHVLRDQGVSYQAYISQISYLLFLKMDEERVEQIGEASMLPEGARWGDIKDLSGEALNAKYVKLLDTLSRQGGIIGAIFLKAQSEIQDPAKLKRLVGLIDSEVWLGLPVDVKGNIYEGLLARNAEDVKSGAGKYFTPRPLIESMVQVVDPKPHQTVHDPACGTAGFLLAAWEHMKQHPKARDRGVYSALKNKFSGIDIVPEVVRLAAMNLYLHGITGVESIVEAKDALLGAGGKTYDVILTNPPFGKKQSYRIVRDDGEIDSEREDYDRQDFFVTTSNKQLNFLQHIMTVLALNGEAAVVLPDNVLFEGGAGNHPPPSSSELPHPAAAADHSLIFRFSEFDLEPTPTQSHNPPRSVPARGAFRPIVTKRGAGCDGRFGFGHAHDAGRTKGPRWTSQGVWS